MIALGLDIGGTKIEVQSFAPDWSLRARRRVPTPTTHAAFIAAIAQQVQWATGGTLSQAPIGISSAGYTNPKTGLFLAANLPASGKPFLADLTQALGKTVTLVNDAQAFAQSEAAFGAARSERIVAGVILGTGIGGGIVIDRQLHVGPHAIAGEFGHTSAPANVVQKWDLPIVACGCGRMGCIETLASGPGLKRLSQAMIGRDLAPVEIGELRGTDTEVATVWQAWCELVAEHLLGITLSVDPDVYVLGGGLSKIPGVTEDLVQSLSHAHFIKEAGPAIRLAEGGDASGARGAAYAAWRSANGAD